MHYIKTTLNNSDKEKAIIPSFVLQNAIDRVVDFFLLPQLEKNVISFRTF